MQEHFNENYMESDKYVDARFSGKVNENIDWKKDGVYNVTVSGKLTVHGVDKDRTIPGTITVKNGIISILTKFDISCKEHGIKIPSMMTEKIAETVAVTVNGAYTPFVKK
jgi:polyisoprenoid-binding protein YceI